MLTATGPGGTDTETKTVVVSAPPVAAFTSVPTGLSAAFDASTTTGTAPIVYTWAFGDGSTGSGVTPTHVYTVPGTYSVVLTATGPGGTDTETKSVVVSAPPVAAFTSAPTGLSVTFNASTSTGTAPLTYAWTFGDGSTGAGVSLTRNYASAGTYTVALTVTGPGGVDTETKQISVSVPAVKPVASFTSVPTGLSAAFDASTSTGTAPPTYAWTFGDGSTAPASTRPTATPSPAPTRSP